MAPIYTVEKRGFCELVQTLDPRYEMPSRKHLNKVVLPALYDECRAKVEEEIHKGMFYATTTDMWSSRTTHPYMSLTIHFIDQAWNLRSRCLQTSYFPEDHTGQEIARGLSEALESWGLNQDHLICVTTDNASNNILALELMNETTRLQCFGHRLHLAIASGYCKVSRSPVPELSAVGSGRPGLLFTAVMVVTTVPQGITVRSISTRLVGAGVGGCQERTSLGSSNKETKTQTNPMYESINNPDSTRDRTRATRDDKGAAVKFWSNRLCGGEITNCCKHLHRKKGEVSQKRISNRE
ncbi:Zinc finger BED domain-containing protein 1 [Merluccius polli]|uniref:Zinc finger BED domain-containing protein 1 n=1 Tax=Merluccius polli TaxID=89951 RepID=A0AA47NNZ6_MERPO|nr:Zinc finger BED domain-containing protein 1 [Merluccius polli]